MKTLVETPSWFIPSGPLRRGVPQVIPTASRHGLSAKPFWANFRIPSFRGCYLLGNFSSWFYLKYPQVSSGTTVCLGLCLKILTALPLWFEGGFTPLRGPKHRICSRPRSNTAVDPAPRDASCGSKPGHDREVESCWGKKAIDTLWSTFTQTNWTITMLFMGKSTNSMALFNVANC